MLHPFSAPERLMRYVQIDTQSDPYSHTSPSTAKQKVLSALLVDELKALGIEDASFNEFGYVYATIPANTLKEVPVICFCSHIDTAPDCSGTNVKPILHSNYQGQSIILPDDSSQVLSQNNHPQLANYLGDDIITASG
ncbi:MAG: peptidase T, partial [Chitinophagaceae bacterium]